MGNFSSEFLAQYFQVPFVKGTMKRNVLFMFVVLMALTSCNKKIHTSTTRPLSNKTIISPVTPPPPAIVAFANPMIVIDEKGNVITSRDKLPHEIAAKVDYPKISRSFTPAQRQNLIYRFKIIPPRVIYVPDHLVSKTARGSYCIYRKKFWYWKKEDGLFHLDETYYQ